MRVTGIKALNSAGDNTTTPVPKIIFRGSRETIKQTLTPENKSIIHIKPKIIYIKPKIFNLTCKTFTRQQLHLLLKGLKFTRNPQQKLINAKNDINLIIAQYLQQSISKYMTCCPDKSCWDRSCRL